MAVSRETFRDGKLLQELIEKYHNDMTEQNTASVYTCLRDSIVYIPVSERDGKMQADVLSAGNDLLFAAFSDIEAAGKYEEKEALIQKPFMELVKEAQKYPNIAGIVIDPFGLPFILPGGDYEILADIPSIFDIDK